MIKPCSHHTMFLLLTGLWHAAVAATMTSCGVEDAVVHTLPNDVRACTCSVTYYCPVPLDECVLREDGIVTACRSKLHPWDTVVVRNAAVVGALWSLVILVWLASHGRVTVHALLNSLTCHWYNSAIYIPFILSSEQIYHLQRQNLHRQRHELRRHMAIYRQQQQGIDNDNNNDDDVENQIPVVTELMYEAAAVAHRERTLVQRCSLVLSTRVYHHACLAARSSSYDACCAICYQEMEPGQRVGNPVACNHLFHVDCLKHWCSIKNACPLCQQPVARDYPACV